MAKLVLQHLAAGEDQGDQGHNVWQLHMTEDEMVNLRWMLNAVEMGCGDAVTLNTGDWLRDIRLALAEGTQGMMVDAKPIATGIPRPVLSYGG
jgi:hypothetical protein